MAVNYLGKRYGIRDVNIRYNLFKNPLHNLQLKTWRAAMKEADKNKDGKLTYLEFQGAIKLAEKKMAEAGGE